MTTANKVNSLIKKLEKVSKENRELCDKSCQEFTFTNDQNARHEAHLSSAVANTYDDCIAVIKEHFNIIETEEK